MDKMNTEFNNDIYTYLPHRAPMLMIDKITLIKNNHIEGLKNLSYSDPVFTGHFPERPVYPGVLIVEAMGQLAAVLGIKKNPGKLPVLAGIDQVRFIIPSFPGDQLILNADLVEIKNNDIYVFNTSVYNNERLSCTGIIKIAMR